MTQMPETSPAYRLALENSRVASAAFRVAQTAFRARTIGDVEFLAARAEWKVAQRLFDAAEAVEIARQENLVIVEEAPEKTPNLF